MGIAGVVNGGVVLLVLIFLAIAIGSVVLWIWALVDVASRPDWAFERARSSKVMWILLIVLVGAIPAAIYMWSVRSRVIDAQDSATRAGLSTYWHSTPPGWHPDPSCRHQMRYWDGANWTGWASDGGPPVNDPLAPGPSGWGPSGWT